MTSTVPDKGTTVATSVDIASTETTTTAAAAEPAQVAATVSSEANDNATPKTDSDTSSTTTTTNGAQDTGAPQSLQAFTAAVFSGGFNPPKINTSSFFSSMRSTLSNAKSPTLPKTTSFVPPQVDIKNLQASTEQLANTTKDWGVSAFKSLSSAAQRVSANVTQGIQKEHEEFIKQKKLENVMPKQGTGKTNFVCFQMHGHSFVCGKKYISAVGNTR